MQDEGAVLPTDLSYDPAGTNNSEPLCCGAASLLPALSCTPRRAIMISAIKKFSDERIPESMKQKMQELGNIVAPPSGGGSSGKSLFFEPILRSPLHCKPPVFHRQRRRRREARADSPQDAPEAPHAER